MSGFELEPGWASEREQSLDGAPDVLGGWFCTLSLWSSGVCHAHECRLGCNGWLCPFSACPLLSASLSATVVATDSADQQFPVTGGDVPSWKPASKAKKLLGYCPTIKVDSGITNLMPWYLDELTK